MGRSTNRWRRANESIKRWPLWDTLYFLEKLGIIAGVVLFFINVHINNQKKDDERTQKHLQAWQMISLGRTGDWSGGADGRVEALESLVADGVSLDGVYLGHAWLVHANLRDGRFRAANFEFAVLDQTDLRDADLTGANLSVQSAKGLNIAGAKGISATDRKRLHALGALEMADDRSWATHVDSTEGASGD